VPEPEYACAVIADPESRLLLQLRPATARHAAGQLTCFGGRREEGETAEACLRRELAEELGWQPAALKPGCELWKGRRFIARFYRVQLDVPVEKLAVEAGSRAILASWADLPGLPVSPWHRAALAAIAAGQGKAVLD
jgi:8-oxo-dGTP pyrophosphatase MutT (NUDIX family)